MKTYKQIIIGIFAAILNVMLLQAQTTAERSVGDFTGINANGAFNVMLSQAEVNSVKIEGDEALVSKTKTEVEDGILVISIPDKTKWKDTDKVTININIKNLSSVAVTGASEVQGKNDFASDKLSISSSGAGIVNLRVKATEVKIEIDGAATVVLAGSAQQMDAVVSGAGDLKTFGLETQRAKLRISGAANAKVNVVQGINVFASGASSVKYKGNPIDKQIEISGVASVLSVDDMETKTNSSQNKNEDTTKIKWRNSKIWIFNDKEIAKSDSVRNEKNKKRKFTHWGGIDLGISMLTTIDNKFILPQDQDESSDSLQMNYFLDLNYGKSLYFSLNLFEKNIRLYKDHAHIVTGLGMEWNSYNFKKNITLDPTAPYINASNTIIMSDSIKFFKNKLKAAYIKAPLLLELNTNSKDADKSFHIAGGIEVAYKIGSKTKQNYEINGNKFHVKQKDDYHLADFKYSAIVRAGYGNYFTLFVNYSLFELFEKDKGPEIFPLTAGVAIPL